MRKFNLFQTLIVAASFCIGWGSYDALAHKTFAAPLVKAVTHVPSMLQAATVLVKSKIGAGTGFIVVRDHRAFVWTAAHVIGANVTADIFSGTKTATGKVLAMDSKTDLALIEVPFSDALTGVEFYDGPGLLLGTEVCHVGNFLGTYTGSFSTGVLSGFHRSGGDGEFFDQVSCPAFPGSSGGGCYVSDGRCIGMLVRQASSTLNLIIPVQVIRAWAKSNHVEFAL